MKNLYIIEENKKISGVCIGIAEYTNINVAYIRLIFLSTLLLWGISAVAYIIIQIIAPKKNSIDYTLYTQQNKTYYLDIENKKLFGVCSGLSKEYNIDVTIIRLAFIVLSILYIGLPIYIALAYIMEKKTS